MALQHSPSIVTSGLVMCLDAGNIRSYPGTGTIWYDASGNNNNATLTNITYSSGYLIFNGTSGYGLVSNNLSPGTGNFAVSVWYYKQDTSPNRYVWDFGNNGGTYATGTSIEPGARYYNPTSGSSTSVYTSGPVLSVNTWYNTVITRTSGTTYIYNNGSLITSAADAGDIGSWGTALTIGNYGGGGGYNHYGYMSIFMVYNIGLTSSQVTQNFNAIRGRYGI
jgi:hypothetical protein